jgi:hypothetical protein
MMGVNLNGAIASFHISLNERVLHPAQVKQPQAG